MWYYQKANTDHTRNAIEQFTWDRSFKTLDLNEIVFSCNRIIKNILSDYISSAITEIHCGLMRKTMLLKVTFIIIRIPSYLIKLNVAKMN